MGTKISLLPDASPLDGSELVPIDQAAETRKTTTGDIAALSPPPPPPPSFSGVRTYNVGSDSITPGTAATASFSGAAWDTDAYWSSGSPNLIVMPFDGFYHFDAGVLFGGFQVGAIRPFVQITGPGGQQIARYFAAAPASGDDLEFTVSGDWSFAAGDQVHVEATIQGADSSFSVSLGAHFLAPFIPGPPIIHLSDTFVDVNGTLLTAHVMDVGPGWSFVQGTFEIQGNAATPLTYADNDFVTSDASFSNYALSADLMPTDNGSAGALPALCFRVVDVSNYAMVSLDSLNGLFTIYERIGGLYFLRASVAAPQTSGTSYAVDLVLNGSSVSATLNGASAISYGALTVGPGSTLCGLRLGLNGSGPPPAARPTWKNFLCTSS